MIQPQITRIAPSPSGKFHIGTARTALMNYMAARASGGKFIVRIDDTNPERNKEEYVQIIFDSLKWLGLDHDSSFRQSERVASYKDIADKFLVSGLARVADNGAAILKIPGNMPKSWTDAIAGEIRITDKHLELIDNLVLTRGGDRLGEPTYQFSSVVDDRYYAINHIIRGKDHTDNTPKQIAIWLALNNFYHNEQPLPKFSHIGLIFKDGKKLSKRDGAASLLAYKETYSPHAMCNFLLRMGWSPKEDNKENSVLPMERALKMFLTEGRMRSNEPNFDQAKLDWYNKVYAKG